MVEQLLAGQILVYNTKIFNRFYYLDLDSTDHFNRNKSSDI